MSSSSPFASFARTLLSARGIRTAFSRDLPALPIGAEATVTKAGEFRARCRSGEWSQQNSGQAPGHVHANLVIVPQEHAFDFLCFALANPRPCPLLAVTAPGDPSVKIAKDSDVRSDCPRYNVYRFGELVDSPTDVVDLYSTEMGEAPVGFLLGCSFTWENELSLAGLEPRHITNGTNVPMYLTNVPNIKAGPFGGHLVVSMRPFASVDDCIRAGSITGRYPGAHGSPVHWGDPAVLGIDSERLMDGSAPDWGDAVQLSETEVPCFWACGVTPQTALIDAKLPIAITHAPGHMFITDLMDKDLLIQEE